MDIFPSSEADGFDQESIEAHSRLVPVRNSSAPAKGGNFFVVRILMGHLCAEQTEL